MSEDLNPYASPGMHQMARPVSESSRYVSLSGVFLFVDACLSPIVLFLGNLGLMFGPARPTWIDWITSIAPAFLCPFLGLLAAVLLIRRNKKALAIAYAAGTCAIIMLLIVPIILYWRHTIDPNSMPIDEVYVRIAFVITRAAWNAGYIFAARSFAQK